LLHLLTAGYGTSWTSGNVRLKSAKWAKADIDQVAVTNRDFMSTRPSTTLADLFTLLFAANPFSAVRASLRQWSSDEVEDGLAHGGQCRPRRQPVDSFFPALLF
jgi:hypothetical protein